MSGEMMQQVGPIMSTALGAARMASGDMSGALQVGQGITAATAKMGNPRAVPPGQAPPVPVQARPGPQNTLPPPRPSPASVTPPPTPAAAGGMPPWLAPGGGSPPLASAGAPGGLPPNLSPQLLARLRMLAQAGGA